MEDELEALCRLHAARAELVLSGDLESFIGVASTVEAFPFREDADSEDEGEATDFNPPPAMFAFSLSAGDGAGGAEGAQERLDDGRRRRLAALENCLDAFDRYITGAFFCLGSKQSCVLLCRLGFRTLRAAVGPRGKRKLYISLQRCRCFCSAHRVVRCRHATPLVSW